MHYADELPPADIPIVAYGIKYNILRRPRQRSFKVRVVPATTPAEETLKYHPAGVFLSTDDPEAMPYAHAAARNLLGKVPIYGIYLGQQILGHAFGGRTFKLQFGHRGANRPVKELASGKVAITAQNHSFAVDPESRPSGVEVTHINLNDQTVEGMRHKQWPVFSVQCQPEASPGPHDADGLFDRFRELIEKSSSARRNPAVPTRCRATGKAAVFLSNRPQHERLCLCH